MKASQKNFFRSDSFQYETEEALNFDPNRHPSNMLISAEYCISAGSHDNDCSASDDYCDRVNDEEPTIFIKTSKPSYNTGEPITVRHLILDGFKRFECPSRGIKHNHKSCYFFHSLKDKRREDKLYTPELCKFAETDRCPKRDRCKRAHNRVERLYHSEKYKVILKKRLHYNIAVEP